LILQFVKEFNQQSAWWYIRPSCWFIIITHLYWDDRGDSEPHKNTSICIIWMAINPST